MSMILLCGTVSAQKLGDRISGTIYDDDGPVGMVNVFEVDATNRNVNYQMADAKGNFSFEIKNPKNMLKFQYVGYETLTVPINKTRFSIKLKSKTTLDPFVVTAEKIENGIGLQVPEHLNTSDFTKISAEEWEGVGVMSVEEALQGRIPGLDVTSNGGDLGSGSSMRIRGLNSMTGNSEPLIVVDGNILKQDTKNFDFSNADELSFSALLNVNPEDIESIVVNKDAAATAVWGSDGVNGVIEIKTKRGIAQKTRVSYRYGFNGSWITRRYKMLNGDQYTMLMKEALFNPTLNDQASNIIQFNYDPNYSEYEMFNNNTDWVEAVNRFGNSHDHSVTLRGGGEKALFNVSFGYTKQQNGIIRASLDRLTTRLNFDYNISDRIKVASNFSLSYTFNNSNYDGLLGIAMKKMPNLAIYREDENGISTGEYYQVPQSVTFSDQKGLVNPLASADAAVRTSTNITLSPEFILRYNLLGLSNRETQLNYDGNINFSVNNGFGYSFYPSSLTTGSWTGSNVNAVSNSSNKSRGITTRHSLNLRPYTGEKHRFFANITTFFNWNNNSSQNNSSYGVPNIPSSTVPATISGMSSGTGESKGMNGSFSMNYSYDNKYVFSYTNRLDITTKLGPKHRFKFQPTYGFRWNVIREEFMKEIPFISNLDFKTSIGFNGGLPGGNYLYFSRYGSASPYNGNQSVAPVNIRLSNLRMSDVIRINGGLDIALFESKVTASFSAYKNMTKNEIQNGYAIPTSSGYPSLNCVNSGKLVNQGWNFSMHSSNLINTGNFKLNVGMNTSRNKNMLLEADKSVLRRYNKLFDYNNGTYLQRVQLNNSLGSIYGFRYKGVYQYSDYSAIEIPGVSGPSAPVVKNEKGSVIFQNNGVPKPMYYAYGTQNEYQFKGGDAIYDDVNHDGNINELDIVYLGNSLPAIYAGFNFNFTIYKVRVSASLPVKYKQKVINKARMNAENMYGANNQCKSVNWRWRVEGDNTSIPRALYQYGKNWMGSDRFVEDASYIRMNNLTVNYTLDAKIVKQIGLKSMTLSCSTNNIFILTKYSGLDPEVGYGSLSITSDNANTPKNQNINFSVNATF